MFAHVYVAIVIRAFGSSLTGSVRIRHLFDEIQSVCFFIMSSVHSLDSAANFILAHEGQKLAKSPCSKEQQLLLQQQLERALEARANRAHAMLHAPQCRVRIR